MPDHRFYAELAIKLENLDGNRCRLHLLTSPVGLSAPAVETDFSEVLELLDLHILEEAILWGDAPGDDPEDALLERAGPTLPARIGARLFDRLFSGPLESCFHRSRARLEADPSHLGLRIRLVLDPERGGPLAALPWELLYHLESREFLGRQTTTPIVRHLLVPRSTLPTLPIRELRILLVLASPAGMDALDTESEAKEIAKAWEKIPGVKVSVLRPPTLEALRQKVRSEPFHVLHFIGHGEIDPAGNGLLVFEHPEGGPHPMPGTVVSETIKDARDLRLVFLNACETAHLPRASDGHDPYAGVASALIMAGIPAVLAMQFPISDSAAIAFSRAVYQALAAGDSLEKATTEGRLAIYREAHQSWEWATPVLFLGIANGRLFERVADSLPTVAQPAPAPSKPQRPDPFDTIRRHLDTGFFDDAGEALARLDDPDDGRIPYYRALVRIRGRRPRRLRLGEVKAIEKDLCRAAVGEAGSTSAPVFFLQAMIHNDFHRYNGFDPGPPSLTELLTRARRAPCELRELERLLDLVPGPDDEVRRVIVDKLDAGEGN